MTQGSGTYDCKEEVVRRDVVHGCLVLGLVSVLWIGRLIPPVYAHHSFAMYDRMSPLM